MFILFNRINARYLSYLTRSIIMSKLLKRLSFTRVTERKSSEQRCNYQNNYYGDQVCVPLAENKRS